MHLYAFVSQFGTVCDVIPVIEVTDILVLFFRLAQCVKLLMALAVFLTYPIQFYVPAHILVPYIVRKVDGKKMKLVVDVTSKTLMVLLTCGCNNGL